MKTDIIPINQVFIKTNGPKELDLRAICCFMATGFFLETDTYWKNKKVLQPASIHTFDEKNNLISSETYFKWHYSPREISFEKALNEFEYLFDSIIKEQTNGKEVILPLSGGLDSRTQAVALMNHPDVHSYSYRFKGGYPEDKIGKKIAKQLNFPFQALEVSKGYLWGRLEELASMNQCYSDFCSPRQMAFTKKYTGMGEVFSLGHWGDVLFDGMGEEVKWTLEQELDWVLKKIVKKGGLELAASVWKSWNLSGRFEDYFKERITEMLNKIEIKNTSAKLRAFKSMYWAPRWASVNLSVFESVTPISLPYYDPRMCEFICAIPEEYLADRKLQIAYIQRKSKKVAGIMWHEQKPFSLNSFQWNKSPYNLAYRIANKLKREFNGLVGKPHIARNWELQFLGIENKKELEKWLFNSGFEDLVSKEIVQEFYASFKKKDAVKYSHSVNMLLTLAVFNKKFNIS